MKDYNCKTVTVLYPMPVKMADYDYICVDAFRKRGTFNNIYALGEHIHDALFSERTD